MQIFAKITTSTLLMNTRIGEELENGKLLIKLHKEKTF